MFGSRGHDAAKVTLDLFIGRVNVPFQELPQRHDRSPGFDLIIGKLTHEESGGSGGEAISSRDLDDLRFSAEGSLVVRSVQDVDLFVAKGLKPPVGGMSSK